MNYGNTNMKIEIGDQVILRSTDSYNGAYGEIIKIVEDVEMEMQVRGYIGNASERAGNTLDIIACVSDEIQPFNIPIIV